MTLEGGTFFGIGFRINIQVAFGLLHALWHVEIRNTMPPQKFRYRVLKQSIPLILMEVYIHRDLVTSGIGMCRSIEARLTRNGGGAELNGRSIIATRSGLAYDGIHRRDVDGWLAHNGIQGPLVIGHWGDIVLKRNRA